MDNVVPNLLPLFIGILITHIISLNQFRYKYIVYLYVSLSCVEHLPLYLNSGSMATFKSHVFHSYCLG